MPDEHKSVQFNCPDPCGGQVAVVGAVIRPISITLVGSCIKCETKVILDVSSLLKEMCEYTEGVH